MSEPETGPETHGRARAIRWILLVPFAAMFWVGSYDRVDPTLFGVPFFYWYQLAWVLIAAALAGIVYVVEG